MKELNSNNTNRPGFLERLNKGLDIDCDMLCRGFSLQLKGRNHAEICGVRRILTYTENKISFVTSEGVLFAEGNRLCCVSYKRGAIIVEGQITAIGFECGGHNGDS